jgi:long-chain acyl-CoA synthetase
MVDQIMVIGEHEKFTSALISPNFKYFDDWKTSNKIPPSDKEKLVQLPAVQSYFSEEIERMNKKLSPWERLNRFKLVVDEWTSATGELSPTLKLRRQFIYNKYKDLIAQIYMK